MSTGLAPFGGEVVSASFFRCPDCRLLWREDRSRGDSPVSEHVGACPRCRNIGTLLAFTCRVCGGKALGVTDGPYGPSQTVCGACTEPPLTPEQLEADAPQGVPTGPLTDQAVAGDPGGADLPPADHFVPQDAGTPVCPDCGQALIFEIYPGYERNEWRSYCPAHGLVDVDAARVIASPPNGGRER